MHAYDELPYDTRPSRATHPDRAFAMARLHGLSPPPVHRARVLELGCGTGMNLLAMAAALPDARFVGLDTSSVQIEIGRAHAEALDLPVELRVADLRDAPDGPFDLVIAHGLWSWVPQEVRDAVLPTIGRVLAPQGVAFVSWNALPGWGVRGTIRDLLLRHIAGEASAKAKVRAAQELLTLWVATDVEAPLAQLTKHLAGQLLGKGDAYLFHDYLSEHNHPVYLDDFRGIAEAAGLSLLGEAEPAPEAGGPLRDGFVDADLAEDHLAGRAFHRSLLCHAAVAGPVDPKRLAELSLRARVVPMGRDEDGHAFGRDGRVLFSTGSAGLAEALTRLSEVAPGAAAFDHPGTALVSSLWPCVRHGFVEALARGPAVAPRLDEVPRSWPLARRLAGEGAPWVPSLLHRAVSVDALDRALLVALDGSRDRQALVAALEEQGFGLDEVPTRLAALVAAGLFLPSSPP